MLAMLFNTSSGSRPSNKNFCAAPKAKRRGLNGVVIDISRYQSYGEGQRLGRRGEAVEDGFFHNSAVLEMLDDDPVEELRGDVMIPDAVGVDDENGAIFADAEAWGLAPFDAGGAEEEVFALEERGELAVEGAATAIGGAVSTGADEDVTRVRFH